MDTSRSHAYSSTFLSELESIVENENSSRAVMLSACRKLSERFGTCIFFNVQKKGVSGFVSAAEGEETAYAVNIKISFEESSEFSLAALHHMPSQGDEINSVSWHNFLQLRELASPRNFSVFPLIVSGRCPSVFYTDAEETMGPADSALLLSALNTIGRRLEELIVKKKLESGHYETEPVHGTEDQASTAEAPAGDAKELKSAETEAAEAEGITEEAQPEKTPEETSYSAEPSGIIITSNTCPADYSETETWHSEETQESSWVQTFRVASQERDSRRRKFSLPRISELEPERLEEEISIPATDTPEIASGNQEQQQSAVKDKACGEDAYSSAEESASAERQYIQAGQSPTEDSSEYELSTVEETVNYESEAENTATDASGDGTDEIAEETTVVTESEPEKPETDQEENSDVTSTEESAASVENLENLNTVISLEAEENIPTETASKDDLTSGTDIEKPETLKSEPDTQPDEPENIQINPESRFDDDFKTDENTSIVIIDEIKQNLEEPRTVIDEAYTPSEDTAIVVLDMLESDSASFDLQEEKQSDDFFEAEDNSLLDDSLESENSNREDTVVSWADVNLDDDESEQESDSSLDEQLDEESDDEPQSECETEQVTEEEPENDTTGDRSAESPETESHLDIIQSDTVKQQRGTEEDEIKATEADITNNTEECADILTQQEQIAEDSKAARPEANKEVQLEERSPEAANEEQATEAENHSATIEQQTVPSEEIAEPDSVEEIIQQEEDNEKTPTAVVVEEIAVPNHEEENPQESAEAENAVDDSKKAEENEDRSWHLSQNHPVPIHQFPQLDQINGGDEILSLIQQGEAGVKFLQTKLLSEDPRERFKGVIGFAYYYYPPAVKLIADLLFDSEAAVRDLVIKLLPYYREREEFSIVQDIVTKALRPDSKRLAEAVFLAGELRIRKAVPLLIGLLDIGIEKENYTRALQKITLQSLPAKSSKWKKWWSENQARDEVEWCLDALEEKDTILGRAALRYLERRAGKSFGIYNLANRKERRKAWQDWNEWWKTMK